ncbi:MAG TPA: L,D-transpeptidase [Solirubrobacteraceae bacterium]|nr:L,D-transpeptidase [Solirubrobacteraceae bacterium]
MSPGRRGLLLAMCAGAAFTQAPAASALAPIAHGAGIEAAPVAQPGPPPTTIAMGSPTAAAPQQPATATPADVTLSNEHTLTTWAHPVEEISIFAHPNTRSRRVARLHLETEDGFPEVYLLLSSHTDAGGQLWIRVRIPGRPNGREGWVLRSALGGFHVTHWLLVVNRARATLTAYYNGHVRMVAPVGVGKPSTPTPPGHFWIRERFRITQRSNPYWPYALGTADYSTLSEWPGGGVVGIHGDFGEPQLIPGHPSHGCVRMRDSDIAWLAPRVTLGTPVDII